MSLTDELKAYVQKTHKETWTTRDGQKVPEADDVGLGNDAVKLEGTVLYADLADSTDLVKRHPDWFAAEIYKNYLYCAAKIIRQCGGTITAYDGDRVMAVFIGDAKNTNAASCALKINWACINILQPAIDAQYPQNSYTLEQKVGVDTSPLFVANTGIRGNNDLVWVGNAANNAAKLAALSTYPSYITADVYSMLNKSAKLKSGEGEDMWTNLGIEPTLGVRVYGSSYRRPL